MFGTVPLTSRIMIGTLIIGLLAGSAAVAAKSVSAAGPGEHASCMGHEAAAISPPGTSDEVPGGMPEFNAFIRSLPGSPGATMSFIAKLHEGSHEACDEALE